MKKMKRFAALLFAFATIVTSSVFSLSVFAEEVIAEDVLTEETVEILAGYQVTDKDKIMVEKLEAFGAIENAKADITAKVTRREMAKLIANYMRVPKTDSTHTTSPFVDVDITDKDLGTLVSLFNADVITGDDGFRFYPDKYMTYDEALVFVINAVGYKTFAARNGGFPTGYHRVAIQFGMLKDLMMQSGSDEIILRDVYKLMEAGLGAAAIEFDFYIGRDAEYRVSKTDDFLSVTYGITTHEGVVTGNENTYLASASSKLSDEQIEIDYKIYDTPGYVYATSIGRCVTYYLRETENGDKEIAYIEENDAKNMTVKVDADDLLPAKTTETRVYYKDEQDKERHINFSGAIDVIYNGRAYKGYGSLSKVLPGSGYIEALDNTGDEVADILFVYAYRNIVVEAVDSYDNIIVAKDTKEKIPFDPTKKDSKLYVDGVLVSDINQIQKDNVLTLLESKGTPQLISAYVSTSKIIGQISEVSDELGLCVNDVYYKKAKDYRGIDLTIGMDVCLYLDISGKIAYATFDTTGTGSSAYGVMTGFDYNGTSVNTELQIRLYLSDGTFLTAPAARTIVIDDVRYSTVGEDVNKVMEILAQGYKNEEGRYMVNSAYVVEYKLSGEKLSYISTGKNAKEGSMSILANNCDPILCRAPGVMRIDGEEGRVYANYVQGSILVFSAPSDGKLHEVDGYRVSKTVVENKYYSDNSGYTGYLEPTESSVVYTLNTSDVTKADILLCRGNAIASSVSSLYSPYRIVTKFTTAANADGQPTKKIYLGEVGYILADKIKYTDKKVSSEAIEITPDADQIKNIKPGYIIQYGTDAEGRINGIELVATYDKETNTLTPHHSAPTSFADNNRNGVSGTIVGCDPATGAVEIKRSDDGTKVIIKIRWSSTVTLFHSSTEKTSIGTVSSLMEGDVIFARLDNYYYVDELITVR